MNLDQLNEINRQASMLDQKRSSAERSIERLQKVRNQVSSMENIIKSKYTNDPLNPESEEFKLVIEITNEMKHDILCIAEMRLVAIARECELKANNKREIIKSSIYSMERVASE